MASYYISDPYSILNIPQNASDSVCKSAYLKLATNPDRRIRAKACLAYDIICNKNKYTKNNNIYEPKEIDCFFYTIIGDLNSLKYYIERDKTLLNKKDELNRSLLYLAARNGYYNLTEYLLNKGINVNEVQKDGSSALHGAAFYGQQLIIQLLIDHGINTSIRNRFGSTAAEEARTTFIQDLINNSNKDKIMIFFHELYSKGLISNIIPIKKMIK
jgi:ankyrin repeat protein